MENLHQNMYIFKYFLHLVVPLFTPHYIIHVLVKGLLPPPSLSYPVLVIGPYIPGENDLDAELHVAYVDNGALLLGHPHLLVCGAWQVVHPLDFDQHLGGVPHLPAELLHLLRQDPVPPGLPTIVPLVP